MFRSYRTRISSSSVSISRILAQCTFVQVSCTNTGRSIAQMQSTKYEWSSQYMLKHDPRGLDISSNTRIPNAWVTIAIVMESHIDTRPQIGIACWTRNRPRHQPNIGINACVRHVTLAAFYVAASTAAWYGPGDLSTAAPHPCSSRRARPSSGRFCWRRSCAGLCRR